MRRYRSSINKTNIEGDRSGFTAGLLGRSSLRTGALCRLLRPATVGAFTIGFLGSLPLSGCLAKSQPDRSMLLPLLAKPSDGSSGFNWNLPAGFPTPVVPADNPISAAKVELGRALFYEKDLSRDQTRACSSCHIQSLAFTDGRRRAAGLDVNQNGMVDAAEIHQRNSQNLANVAYIHRLTWSNPILDLLEDQARGPLFMEGAPIAEMGLVTADEQNAALERIRNNGNYPPMFARAFGSEAVDFDRILKAIASFQRTLISGNSGFDRFNNSGDTTAMSAKAIDGANLFFGERAECFHCHGGFNFTDTNFHTGTVITETFFHSNGLYSTENYLTMATGMRGLYEHTAKTTDIGRFRAPSLRNVALTYPYMHDGSIACAAFVDAAAWSESCARESLMLVVEHYMAGGSIPPGESSNLDPSLIRSFSLTQYEKEALVEFLFSLTDTELVSAEQFSDPALGVVP